MKAGWIPNVPGIGAWGQDQNLIFGEGYFYRTEDYEGGTPLKSTLVANVGFCPSHILFYFNMINIDSC